MVCCGMRGADNTAHYGVYQSPCTDHCEELRQQEEELVAVRLRGRALQREYRKAGFDNGNNEEVCIYIGWIITAPLMGSVEYCDECVCLSVSLCVCVCLSAVMSLELRVPSLPNSLCMLSMAVALSYLHISQLAARRRRQAQAARLTRTQPWAWCS